MKRRRKLFMTKNIYDLQATDDTFVKALRANVAFHMKKCPEYAAILENMSFDPESLNTIGDLHKIPPLPTSYLKSYSLLSKPYGKLLVKTTSSGTGGKKTLSGLDYTSGLYFLRLVLKSFKYHNMLSLRRTNYLILGYQPDESNQTAMAKALKASTVMAPAKKVAYALICENGEYRIDTEGIISAIVEYGKQKRPVRIIGFPAYLKMLLDELSARNIRIELHKNSKIIIGGGWKSFVSEEVSKNELFRLASDAFGISRENFKDHFSTAEHPVSYISCANDHFHVPVYSRVIIRDVRTLDPVPPGTPGLLNLVTPLLSSVPYCSIITDDIAVMKNGEECGCGILSPYFELIGRVGMSSVKTCTQAASEFLNEEVRN